MDIEDLNKSQIILLTLLVSFVTSIATGIVTVTLMEQAPESVSRTITHVVERTVENVVPGETQVATIVKEVPVIVTEEELVLKAITSASPAVAELRTKTDTRGRGGDRLGTAFLVRTDGLFVSSGSLVEKGETYEIVLEDGVVYQSEVVAENAGGEVAVLKIDKDTVLPPGLKPLTFSEAAITIGQSVLGIGSSPDGNHNVAIGIVSNLAAQSTSTATIIATNAASIDNIGGPLVDIKGLGLGLNTGAGAAIGKREVLATIDLVK